VAGAEILPFPGCGGYGSGWLWGNAYTHDDRPAHGSRHGGKLSTSPSAILVPYRYCTGMARRGPESATGPDYWAVAISATGFISDTVSVGPRMVVNACPPLSAPTGCSWSIAPRLLSAFIQPTAM
jgi:hypothetical protein